MCYIVCVVCFVCLVCLLMFVLFVIFSCSSCLPCLSFFNVFLFCLFYLLCLFSLFVYFVCLCHSAKAREECPVCRSPCKVCSFCDRGCAQHTCLVCKGVVHNLTCSVTTEVGCLITRTCWPCAGAEGLPERRQQAIDGHEKQVVTQRLDNMAKDIADAVRATAIRTERKAK